MTQGLRSVGADFNVDAILAGIANVFVSAKNVVPPDLGYPITQSQDSTLSGIGDASKEDAFAVTSGTGTTLLEDSDDTGVADNKTRIIGEAGDGLGLESLDFSTSGPAPTLVAKLIQAGTTNNKEKLEADSTGGSLYISYFGAVSEFTFIGADSNGDGAGKAKVEGTAGDGNTLTYTWVLSDDTEDVVRKAFNLYSIPPNVKYTIEAARANGKAAISGHNSKWSRYGDGLISRDVISFETTQEIERLRIAAVLPAVKLFRQESSSILSFTCFSFTPEFVARVLGNPALGERGVEKFAGTTDQAAYEQVRAQQSSNVEEFAITLRLDDAPNELGKESQIYFPVVGVTGNVRLPIARTPQGTEIQVETLYSAIWGAPAIYMTQTDMFAMPMPS